MRNTVLTLSLLTLVGSSRWIEIQPANTLPDTFALHEDKISDGEVLRYSVSWSGVPAGVLEVRFDRGPKEDVAEGTARTTGLARLVFPLDATGRLVLPRDNPLPTSYQATYKERSQDTFIRAIFDRGKDEIRAIRKQTSGPREGTIRAITGEAGISLDPLSLLYLIRRLRFEGDHHTVVDFVTWNEHFRANIEPLKHETVDVPAGEFKTRAFGLRCDRIGRKDVSRTIYFWLSEDEAHLPVRFKSKMPFGHVTFELESRKIVPRPAP